MSAEKNQHTGLGRWTKRLVFALAAIVLLLLILRLALKTSFVQNRVKNFVVTTTNDRLNGKLTIDEWSGDLWEEITLTGLTLSNDDTIARIDTLYAAFNIWSLLGEQFEISKLRVSSPQINLRQENGQWNFQHLFKETSTRTDTAGGFAFRVDDFVLNHGSLSVKSEHLPLESDFAIGDLTISSSFSLGPEAFSVDLRHVSFQVEQTQLDAPLQVQASARADTNSITLEKLVLATGNSFIRSSAFANAKDSTIHLDLSASPISWKDISKYTARFPVNENLQVDLAISGTLSQFVATLNMSADGLQRFKAIAHLGWKQNLSLQKLQVRAESINPAVLFADTALPRIAKVNAAFNGQINFNKLPESRGQAHLTVEQIAAKPYRLEMLSASAELKDQTALLHMQAEQQSQKVNLKTTVQRVWSDHPVTTIEIAGSNINPAYWLQDSTMTGNLAFKSNLSGRGFYPGSSLWDYSLNVDGRIMDQPISNFLVEGKVNATSATAKGHLRAAEGMIKFIANLQHLDTNPVYDYRFHTQNINIGTWLNAPELSTALNAEITGSGEGFSPASMQHHLFFKVDSSIVNGESIKNLSADISVIDSVVTIDSLRLQSTIAEGKMQGRMNYLHRYKPDNQLLFEVQLKDISSLAPLANIGKLEAKGKISGNLSPVDEKLKFTGEVDLNQVVYNDLFSAEGVSGMIEMNIREKLAYLIDFELDAPSFSNVQLQDLNFMSKGLYTGTKTDGSLRMEFSSPNEGRIEHAGTFSYSADSLFIHTNKLSIISNFRTLQLQKPFTLSIIRDTLRLDTMKVSHQDEAFLEIAAPLVTADQQSFHMHGKSLNTMVIQNALLSEPYFQGMLSGQLQVKRIDSALNVQGQMLLSNLVYRDISIDSLLLNSQIENERLTGSVSALFEGKQIIEGEVSLPFKMGNPRDLPGAFFNQPVKGEFRVHDISLEHFEPLIDDMGLTDTDGVFSFLGTLDGTAGHPQFMATARLQDASLSQVPVSSVSATVDYRHNKSRLDLQASVMTKTQKAAEVKARLPLFINMKTFEVNLPQENDSISVDIRTQEFNLAALNDFLDEQTIREVEGELDGTVHLGGRLNDLKTDGKLTVQSGAFRFVPTGIRVDNVQAEVLFAPNAVRINSLFAKSGSGKLEASGQIKLEKLVPGQLDIEMEASNFTVANTPQYSAVIDLDSRAQGSFTQPEISGSIDFKSGYLQLDNFGEESVENVSLDSAGKQTDSISMYDSLSLNMNITFDRRFFIRNERFLELEIEIEGELDLLKEPTADMQLFGAVNAVSGYALPLGKRFELQQGGVVFSGDPTNPALNIRTEYEPPQTEEEIIIWYIIEGTVEDPEFKYESQPPMELENILSYTLFGQPFYALNPWKQVVAGSGGNTTATDVALGVLLDRVETLATQKLGIDVVKVTTGGENGTSITTGWYINPKVFFAIQNVITGSSPDTGFLLEYLLHENLELIIRQGNGIRQGIDLRWEYDY